MICKARPWGSACALRAPCDADFKTEIQPNKSLGTDSFKELGSWQVSFLCTIKPSAPPSVHWHDLVLPSVRCAEMPCCLQMLSWADPRLPSHDLGTPGRRRWVPCSEPREAKPVAGTSFLTRPRVSSGALRVTVCLGHVVSEGGD